MGAGAYGIDLLSGQTEPIICVGGETTTIQLKYYFNAGISDPIQQNCTLHVLNLPNNATGAFYIGDVAVTEFFPDDDEIFIELRITATTSVPIGVYNIEVQAQLSGVVQMSEGVEIETNLGNNALGVTSGESGQVVRKGGTSSDGLLGQADHTVNFEYKDNGSEDDAGKTLYFELIGLPSDITYQFKDSSDNNISTITLSDPITSGFAFKVVLTAGDTMYAPQSYTYRLQVRDTNSSGDIMEHLKVTDLVVHAKGQVEGLSTTGHFIAFGDQQNDHWHGTINTDDNNTVIHPIVYKYHGGTAPGSAIQLSTNGLPTGVTVTYHTDSEGSSNAVTSFGGQFENDIVYAKFVIATNATAVNGDGFSIRGVVSGKFDESIYGTIYIEDNYQISVSVTPNYEVGIIGGQTRSFTITATRLTANCSGVVYINPEHTGDVDGCSFSYSTGESKLEINQAVSSASLDYQITPHIESPDSFHTTTFNFTVASNTEGTFNEATESA